MSAPPSSVLIVGASAAGLTTAETLRHKGFLGRLTVLGAETPAPRAAVAAEAGAAPPSSVLIVGASAAGLTTAETLRHKGLSGFLTELDTERHLPHKRTPLPKQEPRP